MFAKFSKRVFLFKAMFSVLVCLILVSAASLQAFRFGLLGNILIAASHYCEQLKLIIRPSGN
jgi:hypothetical protein